MLDLTLWVLGSLVKGTALLLAVFAVAAALRNASAAFRHLVWSGGILAVLVLPFVSLALPWRLPVIGVPEPPRQSAYLGSESHAQASAVAEEPAQAAAAVVMLPTVAASGDPPPVGAARLPSPRTLALWAVGLWLSGVALVLGRLAFGAALVGRIVRQATALETPDWTRPLLEAADRLALNCVPRLLMSDRLPIPFACGVTRPAIVLPRAAREWSDRRRRAVLCHELAHVRRLDLPVNALAQLACAAYWFHPLVWLAARRLRLESERACDDLVLGVGTRPSEYADHLLQIVCRAARVRAPVMALPMAERREFEGRMLAILEPDVRRDLPPRRHTVTLAALALAGMLPLAALTPARANPPVAPPTATETETDFDQGEPPSTRSSRQADITDRRSTAIAPHRPQTGSEPVADESPAAIPDPDPAIDPGPAGLEQAWRVRGAQGSSDTSRARVVAALVAALSDSVAAVREDAAYALGELEAGAAIPALVATLAGDGSSEARAMAAWALGQIESRDGVAGLGSAVTKDQSEDVRAMAIWALGQIEDPGSVPILVAALTDASVEIRGRAAWALGTIEPASAPAGLLAALRDTDASVRLRAAWALGQMEDPAAVPALVAALRDGDSDVRRAAFWAVGQIGGEAAEPALLQALQDPDPEIRARAARALAGSRNSPWPWPWPMPIHR